MDSSTNLLWDDPTLYSGSCGVVDTTIRDLDQQIILNDMILLANGGMPSMYQDPAGLSSNNPLPPPVHQFGNNDNNNYWQFSGSNENDGGLPLPTLHPQTDKMDLDSNLCDGTVVTSLPETRNSMCPPPHRQPRQLRRTAANKPANSNRLSSTSNSMPSSSPHCLERGGPGGATSEAKSYSNINSTWLNPSASEGRQISTMQQQPPKRRMTKQQYHHQQKQQHEQRLGVSQATAAAARYAASASSVASETTTRASGRSETSSKSDTPSTSATSPPERECDRMAQDLPSAMKELEEMDVHLHSMAQRQRMMVNDTLNQWTRLGNQAIERV